eukprot:7385127-Prymnesium_polylepis.4
MMTVELALILVYLSVLLVKSCDLSSVSAAQRDHISDEVARAVCAPYGLGDTSSGKELRSCKVICAGVQAYTCAPELSW